MNSAAPLFQLATREELWSEGQRIESRLSCGSAQAHDDRDITAEGRCDPELVALADSELACMSPLLALFPECRARLVATARMVGELTDVSATLAVSIKGVSIVTDPENATADVRALLRMLREQPSATVDGELPILWLGGTASVLFHEAAGHPAEHQMPACSWPRWLTVRDEPDSPFDDDGVQPAASDLLLGEPPRSMRRESFRDVPQARMSRLIARQEDAPFELPAHRIEIHLLAGGAYDPLTDVVKVQVEIAHVVDGEERMRLRPFALCAARAQVAASVVGAIGLPLRYPGVICSREGQEVVVGSFAPVVLTAGMKI